MVILAVSTSVQAYLSLFVLYDDGPGHYKYGYVHFIYFFSVSMRNNKMDDISIAIY